VRETRTLATTPATFQSVFGEYPGARVVVEVGTHSPWISRQLEARGFQVLVADPRQVRLIGHNRQKTDRLDAERLARLGRLDPTLLSPIRHRGEAAQKDRMLLQARDGLVTSRTQLINQVRGLSKSLGQRLPAGSAESFPRHVRKAVGEDLFPGLAALLGVIEQLSQQIAALDRQVEQRIQDAYPEALRLRQIKGVGPITSLCFVLTLEDPHRFPDSRTVGAYLGLTPRQHASGEAVPQLRITKAGDPLLRRYLIQAAHYILGPFGPDSDLRRHGQRLAERGGKAAKKRAVVAVARKLAVLLHHLWVSGADYEPLYQTHRRAA
jgi:transposase